MASKWDRALMAVGKKLRDTILRMSMSVKDVKGETWKSATDYRYPSPGNQPKPYIPAFGDNETQEAYKGHPLYDVEYWKRDSQRKVTPSFEAGTPTPQKIEAPANTTLTTAAAAVPTDGSKPFSYYIQNIPAHVPRPWWWEQADALYAENEKKNIPPVPGFWHQGTKIRRSG
eukprot:GILK01002380.1.p1 GENE.GILK01002380.1~~GILK01002380.1.p1  ORF type:complete len:186 (+),score=8.14 GILK01002380.1:45-560(+)